MIKVIAHIEVLPEHLEAVLAIQREAVEVTLAEPGCVEYALYQQKDAPHRLTFVETWASEEALKIHMDTPYMAEKAVRLSGMLAGKDVRLMQLVPRLKEQG